MIYISILINIILVVLIIYISVRALDMYSSIEESFGAIESFRDHLDIVHGLETYYGDETLEALIEHSKELSDFLGEIQESYSLGEKENSQDDNSEEKEEE